jgi:hypothetical protein
VKKCCNPRKPRHLHVIIINHLSFNAFHLNCRIMHENFSRDGMAVPSSTHSPTNSLTRPPPNYAALSDPNRKKSELRPFRNAATLQRCNVVTLSKLSKNRIGRACPVLSLLVRRSFRAKADHPTTLNYVTSRQMSIHNHHFLSYPLQSRKRSVVSPPKFRVRDGGQKFREAVNVLVRIRPED